MARKTRKSHKRAARRTGKGCGHKIGGKRFCCHTKRVRAFGKRRKVTRAYCRKASKR